MLKNFNNFFYNYTYIIYLVTLIFWIGFLPLFQITGLIRFLEFIIANVIFLSSFYLFNRNKGKFMAYGFVPIVAVFAYMNYFLEGYDLLDQIEKLLLLVLFLFITIHLIRRLLMHKEVDKEMIIIAITAYIMIGFMSSILCWFTYVFYPGSYNINIDNYGPLVDFTYYSIVTMSTLGYGDILPLLPQSRSLALVITLVGQFYMAILIAFLMGKFLNQQK